MSQHPSTDASAGTAVAEQLRVPALRLAGTPWWWPKPYQDVFVRDTFQDTGTIPTYGGVSQSPDIIPYGTGVLDVATAISTYGGPDLGQDVVLPGTNNIYVRARNLRPGTETGTVALYYCDSSVFMYPNQWTQNQITAADGTGSVSFVNQSGSTTLNPNDICLTEEAFYLTNLETPPGFHYCLIAVVNTPNTPVAIPDSFPSNADFVRWVQNNPAVAWRNINVVPNTVEQILESMTFGNVDGTEALFHFSLRGRNLPAGTTVSVQCTNANLPISQTITMPQPGRGGYAYAGFDEMVPDNFWSAITVTVTPPAGQSSFPPNASLTVSYFQYPMEEMLELHAEVGRFATIARTAADGTAAAPTAQFLIPVGECTIAFRAPQAS